jgi:hypothetical protein
VLFHWRYDLRPILSTVCAGLCLCPGSMLRGSQGAQRIDRLLGHLPASACDATHGAMVSAGVAVCSRTACECARATVARPPTSGRRRAGAELGAGVSSGGRGRAGRMPRSASAVANNAVVWRRCGGSRVASNSGSGVSSSGGGARGARGWAAVPLLPQLSLLSVVPSVVRLHCGTTPDDDEEANELTRSSPVFGEDSVAAARTGPSATPVSVAARGAAEELSVSCLPTPSPPSHTGQWKRGQLPSHSKLARAALRLEGERENAPRAPTGPTPTRRSPPLSHIQ